MPASTLIAQAGGPSICCQSVKANRQCQPLDREVEKDWAASAITGAHTPNSDTLAVIAAAWYGVTSDKVTRLGRQGATTQPTVRTSRMCMLESATRSYQRALPAAGEFFSVSYANPTACRCRFSHRRYLYQHKHIMASNGMTPHWLHRTFTQIEALHSHPSACTCPL
jgi:hypothetical protein